MTKPVKVNEVIASFLVANRAKDHNLLKDKNFELKISLLHLFYSHLPLGILKSMVKDKQRLERFLGHKWFIRDVELKYVGCWPTTGDLPAEWCQLSVLDTANLVRRHKDNNFESIRRINGIAGIIEIVSKRLCPILVPGGEIRKGGELLFLPLDADDGSHRLIALALTGRKKVLAYVG